MEPKEKKKHEVDFTSASLLLSHIQSLFISGLVPKRMCVNGISPWLEKYEHGAHKEADSDP